MDKTGKSKQKLTNNGQHMPSPDKTKTASNLLLRAPETGREQPAHHGQSFARSAILAYTRC
jgi:hypothetical protein